MATPAAVGVILRVARAIVRRGAWCGVLATHRQCMLVDMIAVNVMHATIVKIVGVPIMFDGLVPTTRAMGVCVVSVNFVIGHGAVLSRFGWQQAKALGTVGIINAVHHVGLGCVLDGAPNQVADVGVRERVEDVFARPAPRHDAFSAKQA